MVLDPVDSLGTAMTKVAATMHAPVDMPATLQAITRATVDTLPNVDYVSISLTRDDGQIVTVAPTAPLAAEADAMQYQLGEGPCLEAALDEPVVLSENLARDARWPSYGPTAARAGLGSQVAFQFLAQHGHVRGALNLYSEQASALDAETMQIGALFATQVAITMGWVRHEEDVQAALYTREEIGVAIGILMERYTLTRDAAFNFLVRTSQTGNVKLREVAAGIIDEAGRASGAG
ncbi:GAF and ANTAR domain-containing protein [Kribbella sindirgiensis]|uniref:ANTAR domain-containing protein n=1 Tax=Kribbella sindirgiensis TaxID=1124744 RepID=A0A4R0IAH7_9ACTN|nr:GAF and ANTAR domain-containing protein [Kribbella sindirgiensis]TCC28844.1 ANTAR domain-containing protein [Kribbella sindirgiensis]